MKTEFKEALLEFDKIKVLEIISELNSTSDNKEKTFALISETLTELGEEWAAGEIALSQIYMTSRICEDVIEKQIKKKSVAFNTGNVVAITTFMDHHSLGKKIVYSNLLSCGINVVDFGTVSSPEALVEKTFSHNVDILLISTLMYHSAIKIKEVKDLLTKENSKIKILVGGAPFIFDNELWKEVGADAMGYIASDAIKIINQWTGRI